MLVEWLILVLLVPAVLVPVVLLGGFAGCGFSAAVVPSPKAPENVTTKPVSASEIDVAWTPSNGDDASFTVRRTPPAPGTPMEFPGLSLTSFPDTGLDPATMYEYEVKATTTGGSESAYSAPPVSASTLGLTFSAVLDHDQAGLDGWCFVQRIEPTRLALGGTRVRLTLRGSTAGPLVLNKITLAMAAATGDRFDSAGPPVVLETGVSLLAGVPHTTPLVPFPLDRTRPLLVAFEIGSPGNIRNVAVPVSDASMFFKVGTAAAPIAEAQVVDRSGYTLAGNPTVSNVNLIELIEVAS
jgi:Fibronectin type III domain